MSKILVTGHLGWIGSNFTNLLDQHDIPWAGIDRLAGEDLLLSMQSFVDKVTDCDVVVHLAATARIPPSWERADHYRENNVGVTDQIARICAEKNKYLVFASSSSVYGDGDGPLNPYSWTKLAGEESIRMYSRSQGLKYAIARLFINYSENDPSGLVISKWLSAYKNRTPLILRGDGNQSRDFIHVEDTCRALLAICKQQPANCSLDIGTGTSVKLIDIIKLFGSNYTTEAELPGYAHATKASPSEYIEWKSSIDLVQWITDQIK
jgi:nucleoside-diphosphate-sugar epimerase